MKHLTFAIALLSGTQSWAQTGNLIRNANFERQSNKAITDWTSSCSVPVRLTTTTAKFDRTSLEIVDERTDRACVAYSRPFEVAPGKTYSIEGWARHADLNATNSSPSYYVKFYNSSGTEIGTSSAAVSGNSGVWTKFSRTVTAPAYSVSAKLLLYSNIAASQIVQFDGIYVAQARTAPAGEVIRYVAPAAIGRGDGTSAGNAAKFNNSSFWSGVQSLLSSKPVQVSFRAGQYVISAPTDALTLTRIGHQTNRLSIAGADANSVRIISGSASSASLPHLIRVDNSQNITFSNIHLRTLSAFDVGYLFLITNNSTNIRLENLTSVDTMRVGYGVLGFHQGSNAINLVGSEFLRVGYDGHQHFLYNFRDVSDITIANSVFEDSTGAYIRCRDQCSDFNVLESSFRATGAWGSANEFRYAHFIELAVFNDVLYSGRSSQSQQEWFLSGFTAIGNSFEYAAALGVRAKPFSIHHSGFNPWDGTQFRDHLFSSTDASVLTSGTASAKRQLILSKFKLNMATQFEIHSNTYSNMTYKFELESQASYGASSYYPIADHVGSGTYDISDLFPWP